MTPLLVVPRHRLAVPGAQPDTPPCARHCSAPGCGRTATDRHHAVARSQQRSILGQSQALDWLLVNGELVLVLVDVCRDHHSALESTIGGCRARLRWASGWVWYDRAKPSSLSNKEHIWWHDSHNDTYWKLRGFCKGEYRFAATHT